MAAKCKKCGGPARVHLRRHNAGFCNEHFIEFFKAQVDKGIRSFKMFTREDRIVVAVSGGKDSLALWDCLLEDGYDVDGLYIHLGVTDAYSGLSREKAEKFARDRGAKLDVVDLKEKYGFDVADADLSARKSPCSACGTAKRYVFNEIAVTGGYDVIATGHNLDDEAARLLGNTLTWKFDYLAKQSPVLERERPGMARKVRPLYRLTEYETATFAFLRGIDYIVDECPLSVDAKSLEYKEMLNRLEDLSPGAKHNFYFEFLRAAHRFTAPEYSASLKECEECGQLSSARTCSFCRLRREITGARTAKAGM